MVLFFFSFSFFSFWAEQMKCDSKYGPSHIYVSSRPIRLLLILEESRGIQIYFSDIFQYVVFKIRTSIELQIFIFFETNHPIAIWKPGE